MLKYQSITKPYVIEAFYIASAQDEHKIDDIISFWTGLFNWYSPPLSHAERGVYVDGKLWFFSSTSRAELGTPDNKKNGTRWVLGSEMLRNPDRWILLKSPNKTNIIEEINRANSLLDMEYDLAGVVADFIRPAILFNDRKKIYCSKATNYMDTGRMERISPRRRFQKLRKEGYSIISVNDI